MYLHKGSFFLCGVTMLLAHSSSFKLNTIGLYICSWSRDLPSACLNTYFVHKFRICLSDSMSSTTPYIDKCQSSNSTISCCRTISVYKFSQIGKKNIHHWTLNHLLARAPKIALTRNSVYMRAIHAKCERILDDQVRPIFNLGFFLAVCINVSSVDTQNVRTLINLLLFNENYFSQSQLCILLFL